MKNKEIERKLKNIIDNSLPNCLDDILVECNEREKNNKGMKVMMNKTDIKKNKKEIFILRFATIFAIMIFCGGVLGINQYNKSYKIDSIVSFDVNPSVELKVNKNKKIINTTPLNEDGKIVLADMNLKKVDLNVAVNAIIGSMLKNGYLTIDENSILISVKNDDVNKANKLKEEISKEIDEILKASSIYGSVLSQAYDKDSDAHELAIDNKISEAKAHLIKNIINTKIKDSNGNVYTFESLSKLSINELNLLLSEKKTEIIDENTKKLGTASDSSYIGKEKAKNIALKNAGISAKNVKKIEIELDADDGIIVYDIDFIANNIEYEYEINAKTGDIIKKETEKKTNNNNVDTHDDDDDDDNDDDD